MKKNISLLPDEVIDDLKFKNLKIIQNNNGFKFGIDSVLLSNFAAKSIKKDALVCDFGTGSGICSILLCGKTQLKKIYGIEIQKNVAKMAQKSIALNSLEDRFEVICENITNLKNIKALKPNSFDVIISNPPYKELGTGIINENNNKQISRHEIHADFNDFAIASKRLLKTNGYFIIIHRTERLIDIISILRSHKLEPKEIKFIYPNTGKDANLVLIKARKGSSKGLKILKPLYVYNEDGSYTDEILKIYGKK